MRTHDDRSGTRKAAIYSEVSARDRQELAAKVNVGDWERDQQNEPPGEAEDDEESLPEQEAFGFMWNACM